MKALLLSALVLSTCWTGQAFQSSHYRTGVGYKPSAAGFQPSFLFPLHPTAKQTPWKSNKLNAFRSSSFGSVASKSSSRSQTFARLLEIIKIGSKQCKQAFKRGLLIAMMFCVMFFPMSNPAGAAGRGGVRSRTGGRVGGSFKPSQSRSYRSPTRSYSAPSRSYAPPPTRTYYQPRPRVIIAPRPRQHIHVYGGPSELPIVSAQSFATPVVRHRRSFSDVVLLTGTGMLITYGVMKHYRDRDDDFNSSTLGPGVSVLSVTVAVNVPDRFDDNSVLSRLKTLALRTNSNSRKSVQRLVSDTALELLRKEKSIISVGSEYKHFKNYNDAEREYNTLSLQKRSKFDRETYEFDNTGGSVSSSGSSMSEDGSTATTAVIDLSVCIEGDSTKVPAIKNRSALRDTLYRISADAQVDECLLAAEVLWTPDDGVDNMSEDDVYADYPSLYPLL